MTPKRQSKMDRRAQQAEKIPPLDTNGSTYDGMCSPGSRRV